MYESAEETPSVTDEDGKIIEATAGAQTKKLNEILDTDEGARHFGEWSLGFNPFVLHPMLDTLFDEKVAGSFHLTPGNAYPPPGGNGTIRRTGLDGYGCANAVEAAKSASRKRRFIGLLSWQPRAARGAAASHPKR